MGLGGLNKPANLAALKKSADSADSFIAGAKVTDGALARPVSGTTFKRLTFSLDENIDKEINELSLIPRSFRASRSDVVRAAVELLSTQPNIEELIEKTKTDSK